MAVITSAQNKTKSVNTLKKENQVQEKNVLSTALVRSLH